MSAQFFWPAMGLELIYKLFEQCVYLSAPSSSNKQRSRSKSQQNPRRADRNGTDWGHLLPHVKGLETSELVQCQVRRIKTKHCLKWRKPFKTRRSMVLRPTPSNSPLKSGDISLVYDNDSSKKHIYMEVHEFLYQILLYKLLEQCVYLSAPLSLNQQCNLTCKQHGINFLLVDWSQVSCLQYPNINS